MQASVVSVFFSPRTYRLVAEAVHVQPYDLAAWISREQSAGSCQRIDRKCHHLSPIFLSPIFTFGVEITKQAKLMEDVKTVGTIVVPRAGVEPARPARTMDFSASTDEGRRARFPAVRAKPSAGILLWNSLPAHILLPTSGMSLAV